jgi:hypothetical protein
MTWFHLGVYGRIHTQKIEKCLTKKNWKGILEEVEVVVLQMLPAEQCQQEKQDGAHGRLLKRSKK